MYVFSICIELKSFLHYFVLQRCEKCPCNNDLVPHCTGYYWRHGADKRLGDPLPRCIQEPLVVRDWDGIPPRKPVAVHCFCVCSESALLGDILRVNRSIECDLSILSIYRWIFLHAFIVYHFLLCSCP